MAEEETKTLDSRFDDLSHSQSSSSSSSDPSLSRNLSASRLNAGAREFVPVRAPPPPQPPRMVIPPPPTAMLPIYHPTPPFHVPIQGTLPIPPPPHIVPMQNHHIHHIAHHQKRHDNHLQFASMRNHNHRDYQYHGGGDGEQEVEVVVKKGDHNRRKDQKKEHGVPGATGATDSKNGLSDEAGQKILNQVEYYFSDLNLATTDHLMRFINKDPEGYVPISIVASFKKIKALISCNSQLATLLRSSSKLVVSDDGKKVRRQHPISGSDIEELQSRIVVAENLPEDHCHQNLMKIFSAIGSVKNIRTCQPQNSSASRSAKHEAAPFSNKLHAFVEYVTIELAEKAVAELNEEGNWRSGLRVRLMLKHQTKDSKITQGRGKKGQDGEVKQPEEDGATTSEQQQNEKPSEDCTEEWDARIQEHAGEEQGNDKGSGHRKGRNRGRGKGRGRDHNHHGNHHVGMPPSNSNPVINTEQPPTVMANKQPPGPRMPDGTRGFSMGRGKPVTINTV